MKEATAGVGDDEAFFATVGQGGVGRRPFAKRMSEERFERLEPPLVLSRPRAVASAILAG